MLSPVPPPRPRLQWIVGAIVAAGVVVIAFAIVRQSRPPAPTTTAPLPSGPAQPAPDFEITMYQGQENVGGQKVRLSQVLQRGKPVVLNFFAGLCPPCRAEMPDFQKRYDSGGKDQYVMLAVDIGPYTGLGTRDQGRDLLRQLGITFPAGTVFDEDILAAYQIFGMPSTFFITHKGMIVRKQIGLLTPDQMDAHISDLLRAEGVR